MNIEFRASTNGNGSLAANWWDLDLDQTAGRVPALGDNATQTEPITSGGFTADTFLATEVNTTTGTITVTTITIGAGGGFAAATVIHGDVVEDSDEHAQTNATNVTGNVTVNHVGVTLGNISGSYTSTNGGVNTTCGTIGLGATGSGFLTATSILAGGISWDCTDRTGGVTVGNVIGDVVLIVDSNCTLGNVTGNVSFSSIDVAAYSGMTLTIGNISGAATVGRGCVMNAGTVAGLVTHMIGSGNSCPYYGEATGTFNGGERIVVDGVGTAFYTATAVNKGNAVGINTGGASLFL